MALTKNEHDPEDLADETQASHSEEAEGAEPAEEPVATERKMSHKRKKRAFNKTQLVREAISILGADAKNSDIQAWIENERDGVTISLTHISNIKSNVLRERREQEEEVGQASGREERFDHDERDSGNGSGAMETAAVDAVLTLKDIRVLKQLIQRLGLARVHEVVDLFRQ